MKEENRRGKNNYFLIVYIFINLRSHSKDKKIGRLTTHFSFLNTMNIRVVGVAQSVERHY